MRPSQNITKELAQQAIIGSLIGGGVAQSEVIMEKTDEGLLLKVTTPSLQEDDYHLQIDRENLMVYSGFGEQIMERPTFARMFPMPSKVDRDRVEAIFEAGTLKIFLPFLSEEDMKPQNIEIKRYNKF